MPKFLSYFLFLLVGLLVCGGLLAAKSPLVAKQYDYVTVVQLGSSLRISSSPDHFELLSVKVDRGSEGNFSALLTKVNEYEAQGYEMVNSNAFVTTSGTISNCAIVRRPKK